MKYITLLLVLVFIIVVLTPTFFLRTPSAYAATTPSLGLAASFGILSNTYTNAAVGTTINGDLGYATGNGPALAPTVTGTTYSSGSTYTTAGADQAAALGILNGQGCDFTFGAATDLSSLSQPLTPGVYCITGATAITTGITLGASGTYIFRIVGALNTAASSTVSLGGASACDVFWTPSGATTLGANSTFAGTVIDNANITIGATVIWTGRALAFNGPVTTTTDTITAPTCAAPTATPTLTPTPTYTPTPTPTPTVTPTPTPTNIPTPTSTPTMTPILTTTPTPITSSALQSNNGGENTVSSTSSAPTCTNTPPSGAPDLFQVDSNPTQAVLYFAPASDPVNKYFISYGFTSGDERFGVAFEGQSTGVLSYTLNELTPGTTYYIRIRASNGCMPGSLGNEMKIITTKKSTNGGVRYYKNLVSHILSLFPRPVTVISAVSPTKTNSCQYTVQPGDTLWGIAVSQLGSGKRYQEILQSNKLTSTIIHTGQILKVGCP